jgi:hypothetical protein
MAKLKTTIHNAETGEVIERELTADELAQYKIDVQTDLNRKNEAQAKAEAKAALLERLGITEDEAKLLLG